MCSRSRHGFLSRITRIWIADVPDRPPLKGKLKGTLVGFVLFLVVLLPRILALNATLTTDEFGWMKDSWHSLMAFMDGDWGGTYFLHHPGMVNMWLISLATWLRYLVSGGEGMDFRGFVEASYETRYATLDLVTVERLPFVLVNSVSVVLIYLLLRRLFDDRIALLSALLLAFDPFYLAHSRLLTTDAPVSEFMLLALLSFMVYLRDRRSWGYVVFSGLAAGLAFATKFASPPLALAMAFLILLALLRARNEAERERVWPLLKAAAMWAFLAVAVFVLLFPAMWGDPWGTLRRMYAGTAWNIGGWAQFFLGRSTQDPGWLFYPLNLLFKATPLTLAGLLMALGLLVRDRGRLKSSLQLEAGCRLEMIALVFYSVCYLLFISLSPTKYERVLLPLFLPLDILAAVGLCKLFRVACSKLKCKATEGTEFTEIKANSLRVLCVLCGSSLILQAGFSLPHYPAYFSYYNPLLGGGPWAAKTVLIGWGEYLSDAARYLNKQEKAADLTAASYYGRESFAPYFAGQTAPLTRASVFWNEPDYAVLYVNQVQRTPYFDTEQPVSFFRSLEPEYTVRRGGIEYAWIYKVPRPLPEAYPFGQYERRVDLGDEMRLLGYDLVADPEKPFDKLRVNLYWQALRKMEGDYTVYLKVINGVYHVWGEQAGRPSWGSYPTNSWQPGEAVGDKREIELLPATPPGSYHVEVSLYDPYRRHALNPADGPELLLGPVEIPRRPPPAPEELDVEHPLEASMSDRIRLLGYNIEGHYRPGGSVHLTLFWQALERMDDSYTVFTHLVDEAGRLQGQKDNEPVDGFYPTTAWEAGEIVRDQYDVPLAPDAPPGEYQLVVGMYLAETGERLGEITLEKLQLEGE